MFTTKFISFFKKEISFTNMLTQWCTAMRYYTNRFLCAVLLSSLFSLSSFSQTPGYLLENNYYRISVDPATGSVSSFFVKQNNCDLILEKKLIANFRICLQSKNNLSNYIDGAKQKIKFIKQENDKITVAFSGMHSVNGNYSIDLVYSIALIEDYVSFKAKLTNNEKNSISEFWFPRLGGLTQFGNDKDAGLAIPGYDKDCKHKLPIFKKFPGSRNLGAEAAEFSSSYPGLSMPWWSIYDAANKSGLYLGYNDTIFRYSTFHMYLTPGTANAGGDWLTTEQAVGNPLGIIFSHVRYPFIHSGETFNTGEFIVRAHKGDWHTGSQFYRKWFMTHFPFDNSDSWLRKKSSWFTSIIYQPEDRVVTNFKGYNQWTKDAKKYSISTYELIGWNDGGLERNYPLYVPEKKLGGKGEFKELLKSIKDRGDHCLLFCNYNILDQNTQWYKKELFKYQAQDQFGKQAIWMGWGESTLLARNSLSVRYHVRSSVVPGIRKILDDQLVQLVKDGAQALQIDKMVVGFSLDFNPLNKLKPDVALCQGLVNAIDTLNKKCLAVNKDFRMASECGTDRFLPYFNIGYRSASGYEMSPLHYVFPEWTSCIHVSESRDFKSVNGAVLTGAVICVEPETYQGTLNQPLYQDLAKYIQEVESIRNELTDYIFIGNYKDNIGAKIVEADAKDAGKLYYKVWTNAKTGKRAIVIANDADKPVVCNWEFEENNPVTLLKYEPFKQTVSINKSEPLIIKENGLAVLIEK